MPTDSAGSSKPWPSSRVERRRGGEDAGQRLVHRVLEQAGVAPGRAGRHLVALVEAHAHSVLGQEGGERTADDAAADDRDVGCVCAHRRQANVRAWPQPPMTGSRSSPRRSAGPRPTPPRCRRCSSSRRSPRTPPSAARRRSRAGWPRPSGAPRRTRWRSPRRSASSAAARASASGSLIPSNARSGSAATSHRRRARPARRASAPRASRPARSTGSAAGLVAGGERLAGRRGRHRVERRQPRDQLRRHERHVAGEHDDGARRRALERGDDARERMRGLLGLGPHRDVERRQLRPRLGHDDRLQARRRRAAASAHAMSGRPPRARPAPSGDPIRRERPPARTAATGAAERARRSRQRHLDLARLPARPRQRQLELAPAGAARHGRRSRTDSVGPTRRPSTPASTSPRPPRPAVRGRRARAPRRSRTARAGGGAASSSSVVG